MKKITMTAGLILLLAAAPALAQMMGYGQHMYRQQQQQQQETPQQYNPYPMYPGMMGAYGYGMGPMMGGWGYGMGPQMMGGYGYGMGPMMGGYGMGHHMVPGYGMPGGCGAWQGGYFESQENYMEFLKDTLETRRKMHNLMFDYNEELRSPEPDRKKLQEMQQEMDELRSKVSKYKEE